MANNENIKQYEFKKGQSGNPKGRPEEVRTGAPLQKGGLKQLRSLKTLLQVK